MRYKILKEVANPQLYGHGIVIILSEAKTLIEYVQMCCASRKDVLEVGTFSFLGEGDQDGGDIFGEFSCAGGVK